MFKYIDFFQNELDQLNFASTEINRLENELDVSCEYLWTKGGNVVNSYELRVVMSLIFMIMKGGNVVNIYELSVVMSLIFMN